MKNQLLFIFSLISLYCQAQRWSFAGSSYFQNIKREELIIDNQTQDIHESINTFGLAINKYFTKYSDTYYVGSEFLFGKEQRSRTNPASENISFFYDDAYQYSAILWGGMQLSKTKHFVFDNALGLEYVFKSEVKTTKLYHDINNKTTEIESKYSYPILNNRIGIHYLLKKWSIDLFLFSKLKFKTYNQERKTIYDTIIEDINLDEIIETKQYKEKTITFVPFLPTIGFTYYIK